MLGVFAVFTAPAGPALAAAQDGTVTVPSGQMILPYEALWEDHAEAGQPQETWLVLRFLAPDIARAKGKIKFGDASPDLDTLCQKVGLPLISLTGGGVDQVLVVLMDQPLPRGTRKPEITKFMNAYRVTKGTCEWE